MRIIDKKNNKALTSVLILLTPKEATELWNKVKSIDPKVGDHVHINDLEFTREVTIAIYTDQNQHLFTEEIRNIIREN
jgi:hypothetical protein